MFTERSLFEKCCIQVSLFFSDKLEELKLLFLEGEVSELKESLEKERKENQRLLTIIKSKLQTRESLSASVDNL